MADLRETSGAALEQLMSRLADMVAVRVLSQLRPDLLAQNAAGQSDRQSPAQAQTDRPGGTVTALRPTADTKLATESQIERLGNIRKVDRLWAIIDEITGGRNVSNFAELTSAEAKTALDAFYEGSGGTRQSGGDRGRSFGGGRR